MPAAPFSAHLVDLWQRHPHLRIFEGYLAGVDPFLRGEAMPACRAGQQSFNIDHLGNVSPCIEKLHLRAGNIRREPWSVISERLAGFTETRTCTDCWTSCRGFVEEMSGRPKLRSWREFLGDFT